MYTHRAYIGIGGYTHSVVERFRKAVDYQMEPYTSYLGIGGFDGITEDTLVYEKVTPDATMPDAFNVLVLNAKNTLNQKSVLVTGQPLLYATLL